MQTQVITLVPLTILGCREKVSWLKLLIYYSARPACKTCSSPSVLHILTHKCKKKKNKQINKCLFGASQPSEAGRHQETFSDQVFQFHLYI